MVLLSHGNSIEGGENTNSKNVLKRPHAFNTFSLTYQKIHMAARAH
jgi:hypothetical protein